jgi:DNA excision repair protein ERCC-2
MLDPKVAKMVSKELEAESIVVFDEAHNIDSVCIEALSVTINDRGLEYAARSLGRLASEVSRQKASDNQRLQQEYQNLVNGLIDQGLLDAPANESTLGSVSTGTGDWFLRLLLSPCLMPSLFIFRMC